MVISDGGGGDGSDGDDDDGECVVTMQSNDKLYGMLR